MPERTFGTVINPSDDYSIETTDWLASCLAVLLIGNGKMALREERDGGRNMPLFFFGGTDEWFASEFGMSLEAALEDCAKSRIADALDTLLIGDREQYERLLAVAGPEKAEEFRVAWQDEKRTSMSDFGTYAQKLAKQFREVPNV